MTADEQQAWEQVVTKASAQRSYTAVQVENRRRTLNQALAANKQGRARQAARWLDSAQQTLNEIEAILAANADLIRLRGQEG